MKDLARLFLQIRPHQWYGWIILAVLLFFYGYGFWHHPWIMGSFMILVVVWAQSSNAVMRYHLGVLAAGRTAESLYTFAKSFEARNVEPWVIRAVYEQVQDYLSEAYPDFPLRAQDRFREDLQIDENLADLVEETARRAGRVLDHFNPGSLKTVGDLVFLFNQRPQPANDVAALILDLDDKIFSQTQ